MARKKNKETQQKVFHKQNALFISKPVNCFQF